MIKKITALLIVLISVNLSFSLRIGLDSGHSIKELYKSGDAFDVMIKDPVTKKSVPAPYFSLAWPAGGVKVNGIGIPANLFGTYVMVSNSVDFSDWVRRDIWCTLE